MGDRAKGDLSRAAATAKSTPRVRETDVVSVEMSEHPCERQV